MVTWKIVEAPKTLVLYIYIYIDYKYLHFIYLLFKNYQILYSLLQGFVFVLCLIYIYFSVKPHGNNTIILIKLKDTTSLIRFYFYYYNINK